MVEVLEIKDFSEENRIHVQRFLKVLVGEGMTLSESSFCQILDSGCSHLFFVYYESCVAGMLTVGVYESPTGRKAWIEDVVVDPVFQGKGLGKKLVEHAIQFSEKMGANTLMLTSNPKRISANFLYQSQGFERRETNVYKKTLKN